MVVVAMENPLPNAIINDVDNYVTRFCEKRQERMQRKQTRTEIPLVLSAEHVTHLTPCCYN